MAVEIGAGQMLAEFEAGLNGILAGEEKLVEVNFPEDYHGKDVAGKTARFSLKATRVSEAVLPEIDEALAKTFGIEDGDLDKFRADILAGLLDENQIIAPSALVVEEVKSLKMQAAERMGQDLESFDPSSIPDSLFEEEAGKRVRTGLLIGEVIKSENIRLDQGLLESTLTEMAAAYEQPEQMIEYYRQNKDARTSLEAMVLEEQVVSHILSKARVTDKETSFEEMMDKSS
jgi:trigger factor